MDRLTSVEERFSKIDALLITNLNMLARYRNDNIFLSSFDISDESLFMSHQQLFFLLVKKFRFVQLVILLLDVEEESEQMFNFVVDVFYFWAFVEKVEGGALDGYLFLAFAHRIGWKGIFELA